MDDRAIEQGMARDPHGCIRHAPWLAAMLGAILVCGAYWYTVSDRKLVLIVTALFGIIPVTAFLLHMSGILRDARKRLVAFASTLLVSSVLFAVLFPPFSVPDEYHHYLSSYWLSECIAGEASWSHPETLDMRLDDWELYSNHGARDDSLDYQAFKINAAEYQKIADEFSLFEQQDGQRSVPDYAMFGFTLSGENAIAKVGSVVGVALAKLLGLGAYPLFYLGRIFSAFFFVACVVAAVRIAPVGKNVLMGVALLPMTLHLAASYSYDGGTIALSFLFIAFVLRAMLGEGELNRTTLIALAVLTVLLAPCKAVYVLEMGLVCCIPQRRFSSQRVGIAYKGAIICLGAAVVMVAKLTTVASVTAGTTTHAFPGETTFSLASLASDPLGTASLFFRTLDLSGDYYWMTAIGSRLGWLQGDMPAFFMGAYVLVLLYIAQRSADDSLSVKPWWRGVFAAIAIVVWLAVMLSMAVSWTPSSAATIQGVQGRYILPVLPLLFLALRSGKLTSSGDSFAIALIAPTLLNTLFMARFLALVLTA